MFIFISKKKKIVATHGNLFQRIVYHCFYTSGHFYFCMEDAIIATICFQVVTFSVRLHAYIFFLTPGQETSASKIKLMFANISFSSLLLSLSLENGIGYSYFYPQSITIYSIIFLLFPLITLTQFFIGHSLFQLPSAI